jgi:uncharacterized protein YecE (DUF72 family)
MKPVVEPFPDDAARIGCAGWSIPRESALNFPSGQSHLERYAQVFNACEINSSFYRPHKIETWQRWGESVPADFRFAVKAPKTITHESKLNCGLDLLAPFLDQVSLLKERLGPILFQLPPSLAFDAECAGHFLSLLRGAYPGDVVCEPRHASWFAGEADTLLKEFRVARVAADPACIPIAADPGGSLCPAYFRLHGSPRKYYSAYTEKFLDDLAARLSALAMTTRLWCIFDNTAAGFAAPNAMALSGQVIKPGTKAAVKSICR